MDSRTNQSGYERETLERLLEPLGFALDAQQPYTSGERFLMAGGKSVLAGRRIADGLPVIVKASRHADGKREIESEKKARDLMQSLAFAKRSIALPEELYFGHAGEYVFLIMRFVPQDMVFVAHPLEEQFFIALNAFEAQESFHATTFAHLKAVKKVFPVLTSDEYTRDLARLRQSIHARYADGTLDELLARAESLLEQHRDTIDRHASYLTHTDFVPHNFRLQGKTVYVLDCVPNYATMHFGNKYEGWARFLNYMALHSPALERLLVTYLRENRGEDEYLALRLMRLYKIAFLLDYYARSLEKTSGDLRELTEARLVFWQAMLDAVLEDREVSDHVRTAYVTARDRLRSDEEKARQRDFSVA